MLVKPRYFEYDNQPSLLRIRDLVPATPRLGGFDIRLPRTGKPEAMKSGKIVNFCKMKSYIIVEIDQIKNCIIEKAQLE